MSDKSGANRVRGLSGLEAKGTLAHRLARRVDRLRERLPMKMGLRPYRVFLVWTKSPGEARGEGVDVEMKRFELLPTPKMEDFTSVSFQPSSAGAIPVGSIRLKRVSALYSCDQLLGRVYPGEEGEVPPEPYDFFYEVVEDGRSGESEERRKFRVAATPYRHAGGVHWLIVLERMSGDRDRSAQSRYVHPEE